MSASQLIEYPMAGAECNFPREKSRLSRVSLDIRPLKDERKEYIYIYMKRFPRLPVRLLFAREIVKNATKNF